MPRTYLSQKEREERRQRDKDRKRRWDAMSDIEKGRSAFSKLNFLVNPGGVLKSKAATEAYKYLTSRAPATSSSSTSTSTSGTTKKKGSLDVEEDEKPSAAAKKKGGTIRKKKYVTQSKRYSNGGKVYPK